ncbi:class I SAM-dependent methyltransferase [Marinobacterium arenosum]|uniref:class I SAM-dependent methyltransferase n=1 Tax=Marinobacterium arenosum TaxID=2862496 RepID=UPI001C97BD48|nr:class I SAM-dependent methyltransferase [Marinobacterium arenosum]MBY4675097.1 class I SAM-dependent methyltransferase [Marinobacterium arenosum]
MNQPITDHYSQSLAPEQIIEQLQQHYPDGPTLYQLAPVDQLHTGGIKASERLLERLYGRPGCRVLDIGSGLGGLMRLAAERIPCQMVGIDITHDFNTLNRQLSGLYDASRAQPALTADAQTLPFADRSFDAVLFQHSLLNIPDKRATLNECRRVLKPKGQLILHELIEGPAYDQLRYPVPWARGAGLSHLMREAELRTLIEQAGFQINVLEDWSELAQNWRNRQREKEQQPKQAPISPALVLGPEFQQMAANILHNLEIGAIRVVELVAR